MLTSPLVGRVEWLAPPPSEEGGSQAGSPEIAGRWSLKRERERELEDRAQHKLPRQENKRVCRRQLHYLDTTLPLKWRTTVRTKPHRTSTLPRTRVSCGISSRGESSCLYVSSYVSKQSYMVVEEEEKCRLVNVPQSAFDLQSRAPQCWFWLMAEEGRVISLSVVLLPGKYYCLQHTHTANSYYTSLCCSHYSTLDYYAPAVSHCCITEGWDVAAVDHSQSTELCQPEWEFTNWGPRTSRSPWRRPPQSMLFTFLLLPAWGDVSVESCVHNYLSVYCLFLCIGDCLQTRPAYNITIVRSVSTAKKVTVVVGRPENSWYALAPGSSKL